jgi:PPP family 3-phenylpropionic acid transporter
MAALAIARGAFGWVGYDVILVTTFAFGFFRTPMQLIGDVVALEQPVDYARVRMWGSIGFMLMAPLVGHFVTEGADWLLPACLALLLGATHASSHLLPRSAPLPTGPAIAGFWRLVSEPRFRALLATAAIGHGAHVCYELCLSLRLRDLGASGTFIGLSWTLATLFEVLLMALSRHLFARFSAASLLLFALGVCVARWIFFWRVDNLWWLLAFQPVHALTFGLRWVASVALVRRLRPEGTLATAQGLFLTCTALGSASGMLVWGTLYAHVGSAVFLGAAFVSAIAILAALPLTAIERGSRVTEEIGPA